jgi:hypothetical protein
VARDIREGITRANQPDVTKQWKQQYGEPKPFDWTALDMGRVKRVKDREREMFRAIKAKYPGELSWQAMAAAARELGYADYADAWERAVL